MKFLSIDTSTKYSVLSVCDHDHLIFGERRLHEFGRLDGTDQLIRDAFKKTGLGLKDMDGFGVGTGPGSFTGLRIGLATIKGLGYALHKPCYGFSSLEAIALTASRQNFKNLCVALDARRSNIYCCFYEKRNKFLPRTSDALLPLSSVWLHCRPHMAFSGDAAGVYKKEIEKNVQEPIFLDQDFWYPTPDSIALLTQRAYRLRQAQDCFKISATYLYQQDCQVSPALKR